MPICISSYTSITVCISLVPFFAHLVENTAGFHIFTYFIELISHLLIDRQWLLNTQYITDKIPIKTIALKILITIVFFKIKV